MSTRQDTEKWTKQMERIVDDMREREAEDRLHPTAGSPVGWKSIAWWPDTVSLMTEENTSEDKHHSEEAADAVCRFLRREGLGGERKIFPLRTKVEPIFPENAYSGDQP